jgi:hypothetical protein
VTTSEKKDQDTTRDKLKKTPDVYLQMTVIRGAFFNGEFSFTDLVRAISFGISARRS